MLPSVFLFDLKIAQYQVNTAAPREGQRGELLFYDIDRLESFGAFFNIETDRIAFSQGPEAVSLYSGEVDENIVSLIGGDEAKTLCIVKPFYLTV
jgi:hypothetical protein